MLIEPVARGLDGRGIGGAIGLRGAARRALFIDEGLTSTQIHPTTSAGIRSASHVPSTLFAGVERLSPPDSADAAATD